MKLTFKLRSGYEDVDGSVLYGPGGQTFSLADDLKGGEVTTEDAQLQAGLLHLHGAEGPVFDALDEDGNPYSGPGLEGVVVTPQNLTAEEVESMQPGDVQAQHGEQSGYEGLSVDELTEEARNRGLEVPSKIRKSELVSILEANDQGGPSNGS